MLCLLIVFVRELNVILSMSVIPFWSIRCRPHISLNTVFQCTLVRKELQRDGYRESILCSVMFYALDVSPLFCPFALRQRP